MRGSGGRTAAERLNWGSRGRTCCFYFRGGKPPEILFTTILARVSALNPRARLHTASNCPKWVRLRGPVDPAPLPGFQPHGLRSGLFLSSTALPPPLRRSSIRDRVQLGELVAPGHGKRLPGAGRPSADVPGWRVGGTAPTLFDLLREEDHRGVRPVLGHWLFGFIHPFPDGNGRVAS